MILTVKEWCTFWCCSFPSSSFTSNSLITSCSCCIWFFLSCICSINWSCCCCTSWIWCSTDFISCNQQDALVICLSYEEYVFWDVMLCIPVEVYRCCGETYYLLQGHWVSHANEPPLCSSETLVNICWISQKTIFVVTALRTSKSNTVLWGLKSL